MFRVLSTSSGSKYEKLSSINSRWYPYYPKKGLEPRGAPIFPIGDDGKLSSSDLAVNVRHAAPYLGHTSLLLDPITERLGITRETAFRQLRSPDFVESHGVRYWMDRQMAIVEVMGFKADRPTNRYTHGLWKILELV